MPLPGQTISWITNQGKGIYKFTASWTTVSINGKTKKAIKLIKTIEGFTAYYTEYYVKGIGLWQSEIISENGKVQTSDKFNGLTYDPTATKFDSYSNSLIINESSSVTNSLLCKGIRCIDISFLLNLLFLFYHVVIS
jgi:hypothetical protein